MYQMSTMSSSIKQIVFLGYYIIAVINYLAVHASHDKNQCTYGTQEDRIINIHESKALGARLLGALQMSSAENCTAACCGQLYGKCNMAFYHEVNANEKNCFLAMCEPIDVCVLTTIEGFSATAVTRIEVEESHDDKSFLTTFLNKLEDEFMKEGGKLSKCEKELLSATAKGLIGSYTPQCTEGGDYELIQCHGSTGYCWCVDENGDEIQGTKAGPGEGRPNCADYCPATNDMIGTCVEECSSDRDCTPGQRCCSNGCGHTCMDLSQKDVPAKQHPTNKEALTSKPDTKTTQKPTERRTSKITTTSAPITTTAPSRTTQRTRTTQRATTQKAKTTARQRIETTTESKVTAKLEKKVTEKPSEVLTTHKPLEPQDSRQLPGTNEPVQQQLPVTNRTLPQKLVSTNETAAAVETLDQDKPKSVTISYLSSNGALVAAMCFGVLFLVAVCVVVGKRWYEGYQRRHYNKMDYLINGMYN